MRDHHNEKFTATNVVDSFVDFKGFLSEAALQSNFSLLSTEQHNILASTSTGSIPRSIDTKLNRVCDITLEFKSNSNGL